MDKVALIMAGGRGERFWPKSRESFPKQFLSFTEDGKTMLQLTVERTLALVSYNNIFIVTNKNYKNIIQDQIPDLPEKNIILEPMGKDTSAGIAFAATVIKKYLNKDSIMFVLAADHLIHNNCIFTRTLQEAANIAEKDSNIVTIGITPTSPETGYGYIEFDANSIYLSAYKVNCFVEKPDKETAQRYLSTNKHLWNSGMFVWKISTILKNIEKFLPEMYLGMSKIYDAIDTEKYEDISTEVFSSLERLSIDFGVMEKAEDVYTIPGSFGWDDVGNWLAIERINNTDNNNNLIKGNIISLDTQNSIIIGEKRLIATVGLDNLLIVDSNDAILICSKDNSQDIKRVTEQLKKIGNISLL